MTQWRDISSAPRDGTRFWGSVGDDAIATLWHPKFKAFVSQWRRMTMAPGYTFNDEAVHDHSPVIHEPRYWMPLPAPPAAGETTEEIVRRSASPNPDSPEQVEAVARADWILGRVQNLPEGRVLVRLTDDRENVITREQAIRLGTRLLEVGIGTSYTVERAVNAQIGDIISEYRRFVK